MTWQNFLRDRTRRPEFLWRLVIWTIAAGIGLGYVVEKWSQSRPTQPRPVSSESSDWEQVKELAEQGEWGQVWWQIPEHFYSGYERLGPLTLAVIAGVCWLLFLFQAMQVKSWRDGRLWCGLLAVGLGVLSIWPTGFFILWQEIGWGLEDSDELMAGVRYNVLGVGLREEFAKLCCLLPLMPILLRMRSELSALLLSGCVGLGFAIEENVSYFSRGDLSTMGRFLTANPVHIALTGLVGLAVYRALRNPSGWGPHAVGVFGMAVFAHGLYDAFISVPVLALDYSLFTTVIFALLVYQFFRELRDLRKPQGDVISLSANFLAGVSVLTSATFIYLCATVGMAYAFDSLASSVVGLSIMVYLFLREMPETMVTV